MLRNRSRVRFISYVSLSRVSSIQVLWMTTNNNDTTFHCDRIASTTTQHLQDEFRRFLEICSGAIGKQKLHFISSMNGLSIYTLGFQSLRIHFQDLPDPIIQTASIVLLSETWLNAVKDIIYIRRTLSHEKWGWMRCNLNYIYDVIYWWFFCCTTIDERQMTDISVIRSSMTFIFYTSLVNSI